MEKHERELMSKQELFECELLEVLGRIADELSSVNETLDDVKEGLEESLFNIYKTLSEVQK